MQRSEYEKKLNTSLQSQNEMWGREERGRICSIFERTVCLENSTNLRTRWKWTVTDEFYASQHGFRENTLEVTNKPP